MNNTRKLILSALCAALICAATIAVKIPLPQGYVNLGDSIVLLTGSILSPVFAFFAAGIGSALADLMLGYNVYIPATFIIKGIMAIVFCMMNTFLKKRCKHSIFAIILPSFTAEIIMIAGYFAVELFLYSSYAVAATNLLFNGIQGFVCMIAGIVLIKTLEKTKLMK